MRSLSFLALASVVSLAALSGCGSVAGVDEGQPDPSNPDPKKNANEPFVRTSASGLEVVEVDLETGVATAVAPALPSTTSADARVASIVRAGERMIVSTASKKGGPYATYALDRTTKTWRDLGIDTYNPEYSSDLGIVVRNGYTNGNVRARAVKLVSYEGKTLFETSAAAAQGADERYPRLEALSPAGKWFAMRAGPDAVDVREIGADGTIGAARQLKKAEPPETYTTAIACALPTTMIYSDYPKASWLDASLSPIDVPSFAGTSDAIPWDLQHRVCRFQVTKGAVHDVYAFDDRALTKLFSFPGEATQLLAVGNGVHLRTAADQASAVIASNDGAKTATYTALPITTKTTVQGTPSTYMKPASISLDGAIKAVVFTVQHDVWEGDYGRTIELDEELFVVAPDGTTNAPLRLRTTPAPTAPNAAGFEVPSYRFAKEGTRLAFVKDGRIHVRALDGDASADRMLDGSAYVDASVIDAAKH